MHALRNLAALWVALVTFGVLGLGGAASSGVARAESAQPLSPEMRLIDVAERRSHYVDGHLGFVDHHGDSVTLGQFLDQDRPVLLTLNYYRCRVVCSVQLSGLAAAMEELDWTAGDQNFRVVTVSLDPNETPEDAAKKRTSLLTSLGRGDDVDWQFLTGRQLEIKALAAQLGIAYAYDAEQDQFAHPAVAVFLTPDGKIAQYLYGLTYDPRDLKLALLEAGEGKIGSPMEKLFQSCFTYDASIGRYGPYAFGVMRIGAILTFILLGIVLVVLWRRDRSPDVEAPSGPDRNDENAEAES
jgi:protein SCO1